MRDIAASGQNSFDPRNSAQHKCMQQEKSQFVLQTYAADIFFGMEWKDHRLMLSDNMTREYRLLPIEWLDLIWRPDSFFKNAKKVTFQTMTIPNHYVWLYQDKRILYMVK